jgi:nicotinamide-nucleotide amidase
MSAVTAAILSIGDELTLGQALDTNSAWLSEQLAAMSLRTIEHRTVADDRSAIAQAIAQLATTTDVLIITGGLGPTDDDLTREALGDVLCPRHTSQSESHHGDHRGHGEIPSGLGSVVPVNSVVHSDRAPSENLVEDPVAREHLRVWFDRRGRAMPPANLKQAMRPNVMRCLANHNGTAPGLAGAIESGSRSCLVFSLPGPPREMQPMFVEHVPPALEEAGLAGGDRVILSASVHELGLGESDAAERLGDLMNRERNPLVGTTVSDSIVTARIRAEGTRKWAAAEVEDTVGRVEKAWQPYSFGHGNTSLSQATGDLLRAAKATLAVAESCTGGWLGKMIVDVPRSSDYFVGGWIAYSNELKASCLDVPGELIAAHGAVSAEVAKAMASGARLRAHTTYALAITGVAGPDGGSDDKLVGTVYIGLAHAEGSDVSVACRHFVFSGDRTMVRDRSTRAALQMLRFALLGADNLPLLWEVRTSDRASDVQDADLSRTGAV